MRDTSFKSTFKPMYCVRLISSVALPATFFHLFRLSELYGLCKVFYGQWFPFKTFCEYYG